MDAKAKVVAWQYRELGKNRWETGTRQTMEKISKEFPHLYETRQLIPLTDHEAALAEAEERRDHWHDYSVHRVEEIAKLTEQLTTLLTGLEALAGEWEKRSADLADRHAKQVGFECDFEDYGRSDELDFCIEMLRQRAQIPDAVPAESEQSRDAKRYAWLLPRLTGRAFREAGVVYEDGVDSISAAIDSAMTTLTNSAKAST